MSDCPFCTIGADRIVIETELCFAVRDGYPVSPGHTLIVPRRHVDSFFATTPAERTALLDMLDRAKEQVVEEFSPDGFNMGINDGAAAGQTVMHLHLHLVPRFAGDQDDPRGGIRWLFPDKADYWSS